MNKKNSYVLLASLVAAAALVLAPLNVAISASAVFAAGLVAILFGEYARKLKPLACPAPIPSERTYMKPAA